MTSEELAKLYAEVVAARPEAEVGGLSHYTENYSEDGPTTRWWIPGVRPLVEQPVAEGVILSHWLGMLPSEWCLTHIGDKWSVWCESEYKGDWEAPTPLEALAAFLKEKP